MALIALKPNTEQVNKVFAVVEFDAGSSSLDISYYDQFKNISNALKNVDGDYKITIIGYELYNEDPFISIKNKKGHIVKAKRKPQAILAAKKVNEMLKVRALTTRKMLVTQGVDDSKIIIAHPEAAKVKFLYNVKDDPKSKNILENLVIIDIKFNDE
jgi:hypothetical protein